MSSFTGPEAAPLFEQYLSAISRESDRGAVLVAAALLDEGLQVALKRKMVPISDGDDPLFDGAYSPLRSFSAKIETAFRLGLITHRTKQMLNQFRKLRNDFAHGANAVSLGEQSVKNRLKEMFEQMPQIQKMILGTFDEVTKAVSEGKYAGAEVLETPEGRRAFFDTFFAANAMALRRLESEIETTQELKLPN